MNHTANGASDKPATAARMYDYYLGGIHNFPADREAARVVIEQFPAIPALARANRAFLGRVVRHLVHAGIRQFLDIGSGIPTAGNVHEIAQAIAPQARVVYADVDPVAIAESLQILDGNALATALGADARDPQSIMGHPALRRLLDLGQPIGLLLVGVLHFVPDDEQAYAAVARLVDAVAPGSYLAISHGASDLPAVHPAVEKRRRHLPAPDRLARCRSQPDRGHPVLHRPGPAGPRRGPAQMATRPGRTGAVHRRPARHRRLGRRRPQEPDQLAPGTRPRTAPSPTA